MISTAGEFAPPALPAVQTALLAAARAPPPPPNLTVYLPDHRLSPRQRRQYQQYEIDFQTDRFLEVRARLPSHRTVTKARKAELHECFKAVDRDWLVLIQVDDLGTMMIALGFSPEEIGATMTCARARAGVRG